MTCNTNMIKLRTESVLKSQGCCYLLYVRPESIIKSFNLKLEFYFVSLKYSIVLTSNFFSLFCTPFVQQFMYFLYLERERERERERESLETKTPFSNVVEDKRTCKNNFLQKIKSSSRPFFLSSCLLRLHYHKDCLS